MTQIRAGGTGGEDAAQAAERAARTTPRRNLFQRMSLFLRQVLAELKKVVRPTRHELVTYTSVVLVFVLAVMLFVSGLDLVFSRLVLWVFGGDA